MMASNHNVNAELLKKKLPSLKITKQTNSYRFVVSLVSPVMFLMEHNLKQLSVTIFFKISVIYPFTPASMVLLA